MNLSPRTIADSCQHGRAGGSPLRAGSGEAPLFAGAFSRSIPGLRGTDDVVTCVESLPTRTALRDRLPCPGTDGCATSPLSPTAGTPRTGTTKKPPERQPGSGEDIGVSALLGRLG